MTLHALDLAPVSGGEYGEKREAGAVVVVGCDGSVASENAIRYAVARAGDRGRVIAVHAGGGSQAGEALWRNVRKLLPYGVSFEAVLGDGPVHDVLGRVARERRADEVVVGAHASGPDKEHLGNVPRALLAHADCPVVVVPAAGTRR